MSAANMGVAIGRVGALRSWENSDGSKSVRLTVYVRREWKDSAGVTGSDAVELSAFVPVSVDGLGVFDHVSTGDQIAVQYAVRSGQYPDRRTGEMCYTQELRVRDVRLLESRRTTMERLERKLTRRHLTVA